MTPIEVTGLYDALRNRVSAHVPDGCAIVSLGLSSDFGDELAFYRLVFWAYAAIHEAAKIPLAFLTSLPPLRANNILRQETSTLRTFLAHNLDRRKARDRRTYASVHRWFMEACGQGAPTSASHFESCCAYLVAELRRALDGAIEACRLLDDPEDGVRLVADLKGRVDLAWDAHRFDPIVAACASRLGDPALDLLKFRSRHLESWRRVLSDADEHSRARAVKQRIEADLLVAIGDVLPQTTRAHLQRIAASPNATAAALLLLRNSRHVGAMTLPQIVELVSSTVH